MAQIKIEKIVARVTMDENSENPRQWDTVGTLYLPNNGDKKPSVLFNKCNSDNWDVIAERMANNGGIAYPVNAYEKSAVSDYRLIDMSKTDNEFDGVYVIGDVAKAKAEYETDEDGLKRLVEDELYTLTQWANGIVYRISIIPCYIGRDGNWIEYPWPCAGYRDYTGFVDVVGYTNIVHEIVGKCRERYPDITIEYDGELKYLFE